MVDLTDTKDDAQGDPMLGESRLKTPKMLKMLRAKPLLPRSRHRPPISDLISRNMGRSALA